MTLARDFSIALGFPRREWEARAQSARLLRDWKTLDALVNERAASDWYRPAGPGCFQDRSSLEES